MRNEIIVGKLLAYAEKIIKYCSGCDYDSFTADTMLVEACVFNLSQMASSAKASTGSTLKSIPRSRGRRCTVSETASSMITKV